MNKPKKTEDSANETPKVVRKRKTVSSTTLTPANSATPLEQEGVLTPPPILTDSDQKRIQAMIDLAKVEYANVKAKVTKEKKREFEALDGIIKEFMGPYMLIGYDLNHQPVEVISASSATEHDALLERFRRVIFRINQNISNSNNGDGYGPGGQ